MRKLLTAPVLLAVCAAPAAAAEWVDLTAATVVTPPGLAGPEAKAVRMLIEEVEGRSHVQWQPAEHWPPGKAVIVVGPAEGVRKLLADLGVRIPDAPGAAEGYRIGVGGDAAAPII